MTAAVKMLVFLQAFVELKKNPWSPGT